MSFGKYFFLPSWGDKRGKAFLLFHIFIRFNEFLLPKFCYINGCWNILHFVAFRQYFSHTSQVVFTLEKRNYGPRREVEISFESFSFIGIFQRRKSSDEKKSSDFHAAIETTFKTKLNNKFSCYVHKLIRDWRKFGTERKEKSCEKEGKIGEDFRSSHKNSEKKTLEMWKAVGIFG